MQFEELDIADNSFELTHSADGEVMNVPIMEEYPNPENTFDVFLHSNGGTSTTDTTGVDPNAIAGAVTAVAGLATLINKDETKQELKQRCGRRPLLAKNRKDYDACRERFYKEKEQQYVDLNKGYSGAMPTSFMPTPVTRRGLSTGAIVGISLAVVAVGVTGYILWKRNKG